MATRIILSCCFSILSASLSTALAAEHDWQDLIPAINPQESTSGAWSKEESELKVAASNGARIALPVKPTGEYDFEVEFTRNSGKDSIALIFTHGGKQASCEIDAWGQQLAGVQNIAGQDIRQNATRKESMQLKNGQRYRFSIQVRNEFVRCLLDDQEFALHRTDGSDLTLGSLWRIADTTQLGLGAWNSETVFHTVRIRSHSENPLMIASSSKTEPKKMKPATKPTQPVPATSNNRKDRKHVLIVIANQHFFYREYADPRGELERAEIRVSVAAGEKSTCHPHQNSGQGNRDGSVRPDLSLAEVKVDDYDAILFSGGWGSSSYQYAFQGRYNTASYNGNRKIKAEANRLINEFLAADKYTCALCNAVSVLAWARVDGVSPLSGKNVCAPTRAAAAGIYNGRQAQPSCRWHPEANGAVLSPAGAIGRPNTAIDDVIVDGKIITGEDDISAAEMGRRIAQMLSK